MKLSLSILDFDFSNLERELKPLYEQIDYLHMDVMDGVFVPNISFGLPIIKSLRKGTSLEFDTHLMITNPEPYIEDFVKAGSDLITIHYESKCNVLETLKKIKSFNVKAGLSIKPKTKVEEILELLPYVDLVLVMSVEPGFGGQKFMSSALEKMAQLKELQAKYHFEISVDGGINLTTVGNVKGLADIIIAGSAVAKANNRIETIKALKA